MCPTCREPFTPRNITKLFITFPTAAASSSDDDRNENTPEADPPAPLPLTEEQKAEANELSSRMSAIGIDSDIDDLATVLSDVKLWANGVGTIADMETQVRSSWHFLNQVA